MNAHTTTTPTLTELRAQIEAAKVLAMANFKRDWGTDNVATVMNALRKTIPTSTSPAAAAAAARKALAR